MAQQAGPRMTGRRPDPVSNPFRASACDAEDLRSVNTKVLRFSLPDEPDRPSVRDASPFADDFAEAVRIVRGAAEVLRDTERRSHDADSSQSLLQRTEDELKIAMERIRAAEARADAADARAHEAEARAHEAEGWLRQVFCTITDELPARQS